MYFLNPMYHYKPQLGDVHPGEVRYGLYDCIDHMVPNHYD